MESDDQAPPGGPDGAEQPEQPPEPPQPPQAEPPGAEPHEPPEPSGSDGKPSAPEPPVDALATAEPNTEPNTELPASPETEGPALEEGTTLQGAEAAQPEMEAQPVEPGGEPVSEPVGEFGAPGSLEPAMAPPAPGGAPDGEATAAAEAPAPKTEPDMNGEATHSTPETGTSEAAANPSNGADDPAYKHSIDLPPRWSIRPKTNFGSPFKSSKQADEGGMAPDMSSKYNEIRPRAPAYSMIPRSSGITKTSDQPGPGEYAQPSTLYGSHPQLPVPGRVCKSTQRRTGPTDQLGEMKNNPSPHDYDIVCSGPDKSHKFGRVDQASAPKFTMRAKVAFGSQFKSSKQAEEGGMAGDMSSKYNEIRPRAPAYSMIPRSSGITKTSDQPGPGEYAQPSTLYGSHPQLPVPGRVCKSTQRRTGPTDQLGEMKNNPSPHDYDIVCSGPDKSHKFGRVDQASAPKFTMRAKVAFGSQFKSSKQAEEGGMAGDMSSKYNEIRPRAPAYSMIPRSSGITKTSDQPGPGEYAQPSTLYGSHPQLPVPGRVCKSTQRRTGPTDQLGEMKNNPSPHDYDIVCSGPDKSHKFGRVDQASAPKFTMRAKVAFGSQFKSSKQAEEGGMAGDMSSKYNEIRPRAPAYSMIPRSSGITKTSDQPGPGQYLLPSTLLRSISHLVLGLVRDIIEELRHRPSTIYS
ncbi:unnamed protein product [Symbiodinium natans]|uniref:Uncharacterized protein n=1 Tax=Symbiodinium natans TaxID=878477 RepID=A0A812Q0H2_9DINO|nr:unnamed protein product [Symbiodinium natans]